MDAKESSAAVVIAHLKLSANMSPGIKRTLLGKKFVSSTYYHTSWDGGGDKQPSNPKKETKGIALICVAQKVLFKAILSEFVTAEIHSQEL